MSQRTILNCIVEDGKCILDIYCYVVIVFLLLHYYFLDYLQTNKSLVRWTF